MRKVFINDSEVSGSFWQRKNTLTADGSCLFYRLMDILVPGVFIKLGKLN